MQVNRIFEDFQKETRSTWEITSPASTDSNFIFLSQLSLVNTANIRTVFIKVPGLGSLWLQGSPVQVSHVHSLTRGF